jgi:hypothetical protein
VRDAWGAMRGCAMRGARCVGRDAWRAMRGARLRGCPARGLSAGLRSPTGRGCARRRSWCGPAIKRGGRAGWGRGPDGDNNWRVRALDIDAQPAFQVSAGALPDEGGWRPRGVGGLGPSNGTRMPADTWDRPDKSLSMAHRNGASFGELSGRRGRRGRAGTFVSAEPERRRALCYLLFLH